MFANNQQISHRQLFRQMTLTFLGIYLLCIPGRELLEGRRGLICIGIGVLFLLLYSIFLVRISSSFHCMDKSFGKAGSRIVVLIYISYLLVTGIFLLLQIERIVGTFLVEGASSWAVILLTCVSCYMGSHQGLERRARMAEVCYPLLIGAVWFLFFLAIFQVNPVYLKEHAGLDTRGIVRGSYGVFCAFAPLLILPFTLKRVEKPSSTKTVIIRAVLHLAAILGMALILLQGTFGLKGVSAHAYPMIELMAGVNLPGDFLQRVDVFWTVFIVFSLLFALGSVFFYSNEILGRVNWQGGNRALPVLVILGAGAVFKYEISLDYYGLLLEYCYVPLLLLVCIIAGGRYKRRR